MPLFIVHALDKPEHLETRLENRPAHLTWASAFSDRIRIAGPMFQADGKTFAGSMFVLEHDTLEAVEGLFETDPYVRAGLFQLVDIRPFRGVLGRWNEGENA